MNRIGDHEISDVVQVKHEWRVERELRNRCRTNCYERITFYRRRGSDPPPDIPDRRTYDVCADGLDFGSRYVTIIGSDPTPGGQLFVEWCV